jgi:hypothetical protein
LLPVLVVVLSAIIASTVERRKCFSVRRTAMCCGVSIERPQYLERIAQVDGRF